MAGSPSPVQVAPSGGGPNVDALGLTNSAAAAVDRQVIVIGDPSTWGAQVAVLNSAMAVTGSVADGQPNAGQFPLIIGGVDPNGNVQSLLMDQAGNPQVDISNADPLTGNTADNPFYHTLVGDSGGDFAGVSILDEVLAGNLGLATQPYAPGQKQSKQADCVVLASDQAQDLVVTGQGMALNAVVFNVDTVAGSPASYHSFACEVDIPVGWTAGAFIFEESNTGLGGWCPCTVFDAALTTAAPINSAITPAANTQRFFCGKILFRYLRLRISTAFAGAYLQATCVLNSTDFVPKVVPVGQPTAANLNATVSGTVTANIGTGSIAAGTNNIGAVTPAPSTNSIGLTSLIVNAGGALAAVKASAGNLFGFSLQNNNASVAYLEFWNVAAGSVTLGTTTPVATYIIPASGSLTILSPLSLMYSATALSYAVVTAYNGTTPASVTGTIVLA